MKQCYLCGEIPKGPAIYQDIETSDNVVNVRVHKDCYIKYLQQQEDKHLMSRYFKDYYEECIYYIQELFNDDVDDYAIKRLEGLRESKFLPDSETRFRYLNAQGYNYKQILELLEQTWERKEIGYNWTSFELRANTIFKPIVDFLKEESLKNNNYILKSLK